MKCIIITIVAAIAFAGSVFASEEHEEHHEGRDYREGKQVTKTIELKNGVRFPHRHHVEEVKDCLKCHDKAEGGKIAGFSKEWAHKNCKGCHVEKKEGPTACKGCHMK